MATTAQVIGTWILLALYMSVILYFVIKGARKVKNISDYALGNVFFSPVAVGLSLAAAMTSAATFVINPGLIANFGISGFISYGLALPLATVISLVVLSRSFRKYGQTVKALTLAQWIGNRYNSKAYSLFMAFLALLQITFIVLILVALVNVISAAINVSPMVVLPAIIIFVFGYMMYGGANSMVYTNTIQAVVMLIVACILIGSGFSNFSDGIGGFIDKLKSIDPNLVSVTNPKSPLFRSLYEIIFAQVVVGAAIVVQPHIITKSLLLKSESHVNKFLITAVIVELLFFFVVFAGLYARIEFPDLMVDGAAIKNDAIIPAYVVKIFGGGLLATGAGLLVILGLIAAGMSTLEGLIQSVSTTITSDIIKPLFGKNIKNEGSLIKINKGAIIMLAVAAYFISVAQIADPRLSVAILAQNGVYAFFSAAFIPVIFGIFLKDVRSFIPFTASIVAIIVHFGVYYLMPWLVDSIGMTFGAFTQYVSGPVRNPAIASSSAIIVSSILAVILYLIDKRRIKSLKK